MYEFIDTLMNNKGTSLVAQMVKASAYNAGDLGSIPGLGISPGERNGNPLQYSCLEYPMDGGACCPWGRKESDMTEQLHFHFPMNTQDLPPLG